MCWNITQYPTDTSNFYGFVSVKNKFDFNLKINNEKKTVVFMKSMNNWGSVPWMQVRAEVCFFLIPAGDI